MIRRSFAKAFAVGVVAVALTACAGDDSNRMSASAAAELETAVHDVRVAVDAHDDATATARLADLRTRVTELATTNNVTSARALQIFDAITALEAQLAQRATTTTTTTAPPTTTTTTTTRPPTTTGSTTTTRPPTTTTSTTTTAPRRGNGKDD
jgi:hypothetical protein